MIKIIFLYWGKQGAQENRKTGKQENRKTGKQENIFLLI